MLGREARAHLWRIMAGEEKPVPNACPLCAEIFAAADIEAASTQQAVPSTPATHQSTGGLTPEEREFILRRLKGDEYVVDSLTQRRADHQPVDQSFADEEAEATAAYRRARPGVLADLDALLTARPCPDCPAPTSESKGASK